MTPSFLLLAIALSAGDSAPLPPGHPPLDKPAPPASAGSAQLPPGHPSLGNVSKEADPSAGDLLKKLDEVKDLEKHEKTFEIALALGKLYYSAARYADAAKSLSEAAQKAEPQRGVLRDLSKKGSPGHLPSADQAGCTWKADTRLETLVSTAKLHAKSGEGAAAATCARVGLDVLASVHELRAQALFLGGDAPGAITEYDRSLELADTRAESLYGRGVARFDTHGDDLPSLKLAKQDWTKLLQENPQSGRAPIALKLIARADQAIAAGGVSKLNAKLAEERKAHPVNVASAQLPPNHPGMGGGSSGASPPPLTPEMVAAVQNTERTPELEQGLAKLVEEGEEHLAHARYQDALDTYKRVVPFQPENGRAKAGMAWALVGLGKPMADRVWSVAVGSDPAAVDHLGGTLKEKGDSAGAKSLWTKLASSAPDYAQKAGLAERIK